MILTFLRIAYLRLRNNPLELLLVFVMPVLFFSIFAMIFSQGIAAGTEKPVRLGLLLPGGNVAAADLQAELQQNTSLICTDLGGLPTESGRQERVILEAQNSSRYDLLLLLSADFSTAEEDRFRVRLVTDGQNAMAVAMVRAILEEYYAVQRVEGVVEQLQESVRSAAKERLLPAVEESAGQGAFFREPISPRTVFAGSGAPPSVEPGLAPVSADQPASVLDPPTDPAPGTFAEAADPDPETLLTAGPEPQISVDNPQAADQQNPRIAMYAAGIAVLFLLFACTGHAATMLEEAESGTLDRILVSEAGLLQIVAGKWLGIFLMGCLQLSVMFVFAEAVFRIHLWQHLDGFLVMAGSTSAATASFAMLMATICRTRSQLQGTATVIILSMSAMGGSMIPRFVMSDRMKELGRWTFNAWALDGFQKVFWFQSPIESLRPEVTVLLGSSLVMSLATLLLSGRWRRGL
ncbi:ABC transporter permease [Planctomyces bekefii]|uniref:ABC transporter permease n=1 Tax=Planctomyces bekefii TaxID=1653850 RepID=A0A5C6M438_9PLAN|nr:ABC transporter permease [Planctomyces bekefii]